jgi:hypothetical protein
MKDLRLGDVIDSEKIIWDAYLTIIGNNKLINTCDIEKNDPESGVSFIKLDDIRKAYPKGVLTVIAEHPLRGEIYQIGNSNENWTLHGITLGYA